MREIFFVVTISTYKKIEVHNIKICFWEMLRNNL